MNKSILSGALDNGQLKILPLPWISAQNYLTLQSHALVGIHNWIQHVIDYLPLPSNENAASFGELLSEARERKMNAIRRLEQIINPSLCTWSTTLISSLAREILGCLEKIEGLTCEMDELMDGLSNEVYEQLAGYSLSRALPNFNLELAEIQVNTRDNDWEA